MKKNYGGIELYELDALLSDSQVDRQITLGEKPYYYFFLRITSGREFLLNLSMRYCIYVIEDGGQLIDINGITLRRDQYLLGTADVIKIVVSYGQAVVLIAAQNDPLCNDSLNRMDSSDKEVKRVEKPWGYEIWLTGEPTKIFAFKKLFLKAGHKTSLQYHQLKRETNFILSGVADLYYNPDLSIPPARFSPENVEKVRIVGPSVVDIFPNHVHRLQAVEDLLFFEVSTPELDDVIRIVDDTGRRHGRVEAEHITREA